MTAHSKPIPARVYYNAETHNFYTFEREGMGHVFFKEWSPRWKEFPSSPPVKAASK